MKIFSPTISGSSQASGSLTISGSLTVSQGITGSLLGTASWATNALTASFLPVGTYNITSSWAQSVSNAINARTASFLPVGTYSVTSSWATNALTASFVNTLNQNLIITGAVSIGTSSVGPNENTLTLGARDTTNEGGQLGLNAPGGTYTSASFIDLYQNRFRVLRGTNANSDAELFNINLHTGQVGFSKYTGSGAFPGSAAGYLAVDTAGNVITATGTGGSTTPGGSNTQIQYNNSNAFGGVPTLTYDGTTLRATGSFTGSFTGSLFGTASHAITASYALSSAGGGGSFSLAGATDVSFSALADGDLIRYNGTAGKWQNTNLGLSLTPTLSAIEGGYFGGYTKITNWGSYSDPLAKAFVKSGSTVIITCSVDSSGQITWSDSNSNYNFTRSLEVQVQDFGDIVSEITTASYVKKTASFRYYRWFAVSASSNVLLNDFRFYSGSAQSSTAFPANMTSNTAPTPYVASASSFYVGYEPWEAFDSDVNSQWWNLAAPPYQGAFVSVDMGSTFTSSLRSMRIQFGQGFQNFTMANIQGSNDNTTWTLLHTITNVPANNVSTARNFG